MVAEVPVAERPRPEDLAWMPAGVKHQRVRPERSRVEVTRPANVNPRPVCDIVMTARFANGMANRQVRMPSSDTVKGSER